MEDLYIKIKKEKIVVIIRDIQKENIVPVVDALYDAGIRIVEITMNSPSASDQISEIKSEFGNKVYLGAGTVINKKVAEEAKSAGANFFITPNYDKEVISYGLEHNIDVIPGVMTPTDIVNAYNFGVSMVKLFPVKSLGINYFKELQGPLGNIPMIPVGGVTLNNAKEFLKAGALGIGVGGDIINKDLISNQNFTSITKKAKEFVELINQM